MGYQDIDTCTAFTLNTDGEGEETTKTHISHTHTVHTNKRACIREEFRKHMQDHTLKSEADWRCEQYIERERERATA